MSAAPKQYRLGVLLVHGIGTQTRRATLVSWGDALLDVIRRATHHGDAAGTFVTVEHATTGDAEGDRPAEAVVSICTDGVEEKWLLAECWWADTFPAPTYAELVSWSVRALPWAVALHIAQRYWQSATPDASRRAGLTAILIACGQFALAFLLAPFALLLLGVVLLVGLLPVPQLRTLALSIQTALTASIGDSLAFVESPMRAALIRTRLVDGLQRLKAICESTIVIAHSQGAAAVLDALGGFAEPHRDAVVSRLQPPARPRVVPDTLLTFGAGINQIASLKALGKGLPKTMAFNPVTYAIWALIVAAGFSAWLYINLEAHQITPGGIVLAVSVLASATAILSGLAWSVERFWRPLARRWPILNNQKVTVPLLTTTSVAVVIAAVVYAERATIPVGTVNMLLLSVLLLAVSVHRILSDETRRVVTADVIEPPGLRRWVDLYSSADPVPNGRTRIRSGESTPASAVMTSTLIWNGASILSDHSAYWDNVDGFTLRVAAVCADTAESPWCTALARPTAADDSRARWRVNFLCWARWINHLLWLSVFVLATRRFVGLVPLPFTPPAWLPHAGLTSTRGAMMVGLMFVGAWASYALVRWPWRRWVRAEQLALVDHTPASGWRWGPIIAMGSVLSALVVIAASMYRPITLPSVPTTLPALKQALSDLSDLAAMLLGLGLMFAGIARLLWPPPLPATIDDAVPTDARTPTVGRV